MDVAETCSEKLSGKVYVLDGEVRVCIWNNKLESFFLCVGFLLPLEL